MSRIGKKPIPLPAGVKYTVQGNTVLVEGPKGKVSALIANGITLKTKDGILEIERASEDKAALHGLTRALVNNAVQGVTKGWTKELDIVGIGYRAELKGKAQWCLRWATRIPSKFRCRQALTWLSIPSRRT